LVLRIKHLFAVKSRENIDAELFGDTPQPFGKPGQADDIKAFVMHMSGDKRNPKGLVAGQKNEFVTSNRGFQGTSPA